MTSSGYIPGTVDTQSRCWRDRRELHRELPHRCSLSIGERERGEKKKNYPRRAKGSSRRGCGWRSRVTRKPCYCGKFPSKGVSLINANSLTARTKYPRHIIIARGEWRCLVMRIPGKHATANSTYGGVDLLPPPPSHTYNWGDRTMHVLFSRIRSLLGWGETGRRLEDWRWFETNQQWVKVFCFRLILSSSGRVFIFFIV